MPSSRSFTSVAGLCFTLFRLLRGTEMGRSAMSTFLPALTQVENEKRTGHGISPTAFLAKKDRMSPPLGGHKGKPGGSHPRSAHRRQVAQYQTLELPIPARETQSAFHPLA